MSDQDELASTSEEEQEESEEHESAEAEESDAEVECNEDYEPPLHFAACDGDVETVRAIQRERESGPRGRKTPLNTRACVPCFECRTMR
jgi:hypothetical protein